MTVAYVISMKNGMSSFNLDELRELQKRGVPFVIYATKRDLGPYVPERDWTVRTPSTVAAFKGFLYFLIRKPRRFAEATSEAVRAHLWIELIVALAFARDMAYNGTHWVHAHFADRKLLVARLASILIGRPYSVTVHAHELYSNLQREARTKALLEACRIFTVTDFNQTQLVAVWGIPSTKVITNRLLLGRDHLEPQRRAKMLVIGNFVEKKGYDVLLEALQDIPAAELTTWIVGSGPQDVPNRVKIFGLNDRIVVLGRVSAPMLQILLNACDFFCLPSRTASSGDREGFPMAIAEAMAHGKPVLTTRHAGIPEVVSEILVREGDPVALAAGIREMLARRPDWTSMGRRNREIALQRFSSENVEALIRTFHGGG